MNEQEAPVKAGETHDVRIGSVGEKGDGIAKVNGFVIFVPGVKKGNYVKIKITKVLAKVGFAEVVEKLEKPSNPRFANVTEEEMQEEAEVISDIEDTEDFGEDLEDE